MYIMKLGGGQELTW